MTLAYKQFTQILTNSVLAQNLAPADLKNFLEAFEKVPAKVLVATGKQVLELDQKYLHQLIKDNEATDKATADLEAKVKEANQFLKELKVQEEQSEKQAQLKQIKLTK